METYIVRVYRRGEPGDRLLVGTVEIVSTQQRLSFRSESELLTLLDASAAGGEAEEDQERSS